MKLFKITMFITLESALVILWLELLNKVVDHMNKVHIGFVIFVPIIFFLAYVTTALILKSINRNIKLIKYKKSNEKK